MPEKTERILSLDLRRQRFGFVVLEAADQLLDWGVKELGRHHGSGEVWLERIVVDLLRSYRPTRVILGRPGNGKAEGNVLASIKQAGQDHRVPTVVVSRKQVRTRFDGRNKYQIAEELAGRFPELATRLPEHPRRIWETEPHSMTIFDAAALALTYLASKHTHQRRT